MSSNFMTLALRANTQWLLGTRRWPWQLLSFKRFMLTCGNHTIYLCYQQKFMLACSSMSLLANQGSSYFRVKTSSLTPLNFGYFVLKPIGKKLNIDKLMVGKNSLVMHLKAIAMRKTSILATRHCICTKKTG